MRHLKQRNGKSDTRGKMHLDALEARQLLTMVADVNFQPWYVRRNPGAINDIGFPYLRNGNLGYGWNHWKANDMVQRESKLATDAATSTFVEFDGHAGEDDAWEMALPNGRYEVTIVAGDPGSTEGYFAFDLEGTAALRGQPTWKQRFVTSTTTVDVADGRLTLTAGPGASSNKLNTLRIEKVDDAPPAAPAELSARRVGDSSVELTWNSSPLRLDGYQVQQSANGVEWRTVGYASGDATRYTVNNVNSSAQHFRIYAFNRDGWSSASNIGRVAGLPTPTNPAPDPRGYFDGVTVNPEYDPYAVAAALRTLGVNAVRIWGDIEWNRHVNRNFMDAARAYHNLGFHVTLLIHDDKVPTYEQARAYFSFAVSQPGMIASVDRWEIINEPNFRQYWTGTYTEYVQNVLKPAYEVLKAKGELVVGAAAGVFADAAKGLRDAGYLNYVDFANYHPYGIDAAEQIDRIEEVKRIFAGKPLTMTEWNLMPYLASRETWASELKKVRSYVVQNVESAFYYHLTFTADWASSAGLFRPDAGGYTPNTLFYDMYKSFDVRRAAA